MSLMTNYRLEICYDGTKYNGWQRLGNTSNTLQEKIETLLSRLLEQPIVLAASGRTDAGVHARSQVCSFHADTSMSCEDILLGLRRYLPTDIGAISLKVASPRFHARYNCVRKTYIYRVWTSNAPNVFDRKYMYFFRETLNLDEMRRAADFLCGEHDFASFTSAKKMKKSTVRRIDAIKITQKDGELQLSFTGNGFLRGMVRILTGTLLEIGLGKRPADSIPEILASLNRESAGFTAPPEGLILWSVEY